MEAVLLRDRVIKYLNGLIAAGRHNEALPSQNCLRKKFGVGMVTVRSAFDRLELAGLVYRKQGKGCFIRKLPENAASSKVFVVLPEHASVSNDFPSAVLQAAREFKFITTFYNYSGNLERLRFEIGEFSPDAAIWIAPNMPDEAPDVRKIASMGFHVLLFNRELPGTGLSSVCCDFAKDGCRMAERIMLRKPERILAFGFSPRADYAVGRLGGLSDGLKDGGFSGTLHFGGFFPGAHYVEKTVKELKSGRYDTVVCGQYAFWSVLVKALEMTDSDISRMTFGLFSETEPDSRFLARTIRLVQPLPEMGRIAACAVNRLLKGQSVCEVLHAESEIIDPFSPDRVLISIPTEKQGKAR